MPTASAPVAIVAPQTDLKGLDVALGAAHIALGRVLGVDAAKKTPCLRVPRRTAAAPSPFSPGGYDRHTPPRRRREPRDCPEINEREDRLPWVSQTSPGNAARTSTIPAIGA